jgi:hypothetical protein
MNVNFRNFCINTFGIYEQILSVDKDKGNMERADFRMQIITLRTEEIHSNFTLQLKMQRVFRGNYVVEFICLRSFERNLPQLEENANEIK